MSNQNLNVKKRNGHIEPLMLDKLHLMVEEACKGLSGVSASQVEMNSHIQFYEGITTDEIQKILIKSASDLISLDAPNYQYVAARLLLFSIRKQVYGGAEMPPLIDHIRKCVELGVYDDYVLNEYTEEELNQVNSFIDHERDYLFSYAGLQQVVDKYLVQDRSDGTLYELPQFMYMLISLATFAKYPKKTRLLFVRRYYDALSKHKINIPTPINAGVRTPLRQYASCVLVDINDTKKSLSHSSIAIEEYSSERAGLGVNMGRIRGINSKIRNGEVTSTGVIPFLKRVEASVRAFTQNGLRGGNATVHFPIWHQEIEDIIVLKNNKGTEDNRVRKLDYSIQLSKLFYERFIKDEHITLFSPHVVPGLFEAFGMEGFDELYVKYENDLTVPKKKIKAQELILNLLKERAETGRIYIMNIDHCNYHSSYKEQITMSNLCVAGDTKISIKYPVPIGSCWELCTAEIEIQELEDYFLDRKREISLRKESDVPKIQVLSYNIETNQKEWKPITAYAETSPKAKVIKIEFGGPVSGPRTLVLTPEHKIYTENRGYVMAKDLGPRDRVKFNNELELYCIGTLGTYHNVELLEEEIPVYDITVEGNHNFFANDILVHNCQEILEPTKPIEHIDDDNDAEIATCILSAVNVGKINSLDELEELCDLTVRSLDELIDYQNYPVKAAENFTKNRRSLGIGYIGLAHYLAKQGFNYDSQEAWDSVHRLTEAFQYYLLKSSNTLAKEKGACKYFNRTKYSDGILPIDTYKRDLDKISNAPLQYEWEALRKSILEHGLRNSTLSAQPPTESSSVTSNATNGIEPPRGYLSVKKSKKGPLKQIVPQYQKLKNSYTLLWDMKGNRGYMNVVAVMQKFMDQGISGNWSYNPEHYPDNEVPLSVMIGDMLYAYSVGWKTSYYQNTYDSKSDSLSNNEEELNNMISDILKSDEESCESCSV